MNSKYEKKCFIEGLETHPDILRGGHRNLGSRERIQGELSEYCICLVLYLFT